MSATGKATFTQRVADYFRARPGQWVDARQLEAVGGRMAWRTRVSECRTEHGMTIENRVRRVSGDDGAVWVISEYRYLPPVPVEYERRVAGELLF